MYCEECGVELLEQAKFCPKCGEAVGVNEQAPIEEISASAESVHTSEHGKQFYFVRSNQEYYFNKWKKENSWNWVAFFFAPFWLGYRKMYKLIFILFGIYILFDIMMLRISGFNEDSLNNALGMGAAIFFGLRGNDLYRKHMKRKISEIEAVTEPGSNQLRKIEAAGGTNAFGILYAFLILIAYFAIVEVMTGFTF
ncbi:DUF2628 domain-containing protein [Aciduricibacillus chroicocephali]|uniref:DUF2628 domain-containing protein n=1 Tax=Aciduricibacillus chroicocephali TaxID=3054939 RepID=A0ABY9KUM1_9BACI|nr:DUF2628 domain-containing protein [Bacillaceae bacterium 44XB]